ncbi:MAG: hypothetical protein A6F70_08930 [Cycloclasticus sp. symbiont of Bathymodiolus heckerae]|nr:MAG: hypothetical protein A6F70_08930 [Cycloclasticus sp. symbiont of Bathymodiolus heckerae]
MHEQSIHQLKGFTHVQGLHCSSTCIADIARFDDCEISEAMAFGLAEGLGFVYYKDDKLSPTARINGRCSNFEEKFYQRIGSPIAWQPSLIKESIQQNRPVLAKTALTELPYYEPADFFGHGILVVGLDENTQHVSIAESFSAELQNIPTGQFKKATAINCQPFMSSYSYTSAPIMQFEVTEGMLRDAIKSAMNYMLSDSQPLEGFIAMEKAIADIPTWHKYDDWQWHARFAYQSLEKRGTGGGNFRFIYADFLNEASAYLPEITTLSLEKGFRHCAEQWQALASIFKDTFIQEDPNKFEYAAKQLNHIKQLETELCTTALKHL